MIKFIFLNKNIKTSKKPIKLNTSYLKANIYQV
jgi:hypothetical protein